MVRFPFLKNSSHHNPLDSNVISMTATSKTLLVFCDGTGLDGTLANGSSPGKNIPQYHLPRRAKLCIVATQYVTNVLRLCKCLSIDKLCYNAHSSCSSCCQESFGVRAPTVMVPAIFLSL